MSESSATNLCSIPINKLNEGFNGKKICFVVPSYQRGYRWTENQIKRLLIDLYEFGTEKVKENKLVGDYYCLQPIVVKKICAKLGNKYCENCNTVYYEIVDGQQRMITVYILLKYLLRDAEPYMVVFERDIERNNARYELLNSMVSSFVPASVPGDYADAYYFLQAFISINEWFTEYEKLTGWSDLMLKSFMENVLCSKTQVIWYELDSEANCYSIFKNINHGKIPLTDAELVKAMLLNSKYYATDSGVNEKIVKQEQNRYARLWDEIQKAFSDEGIWAFITGGGNINLPTNIDFIIRLIVTKKIGKGGILDDSDYKYFSFFEKELANASNKKEYIESVFELLTTTFRTIQDWYNNYVLHNYIGFILTYSTKKNVESRIGIIIDLISKYETLTKTQFIEQELITNRIKSIFDKFSLDTINYEDNRKDVEKLLMLFNIEELNEIHSKFNFSIDDNGWSVEHIKAQHSEITQADKRKEYLQNERESLIKLSSATGDEDLKKKINNIIQMIVDLLQKPDIDENDFKQIAEKIDKEIDGFEAVDMHKLGNLALLSKADNSSLGNESFYQKREQINKWLNDYSKNVPNSTRKAFLKMYSLQEYALDFTRWRKSDFKDMSLRQSEKLKKFIQEQ